MATYDAETQEFVITTPDDASRKDYIGNAAAHAELAVVFAQLEVGGERHGVHAFVVPVREDGRVLDGVRIEDCGPKMGLNGVDNGRIWFDGVRVPRTTLLNQFAEVTPEGRLPLSRSTTPTSASSRCSAPWSRVACASAAPASTRRRSRSPSPPATPCDVASSRPPSPDEEQVLLDYGMHQRRLLPLHRADVRAALRAGGRRRAAARGVLRPRPDRGGQRRARPADAGVARRRHQGARHLARHPHHPGVPRGVRWRGLPQREPVRRAEGRHRRLHHLRGRQPRPAPAGRQGPAHRLRRRVRGHGPVRHGPLRRRPGGRDRRRADQRCTSSCSRCATCCPAATPGTRRPGCSTRTTSSRCCASARST